MPISGLDRAAGKALCARSSTCAPSTWLAGWLAAGKQARLLALDRMAKHISASIADSAALCSLCLSQLPAASLVDVTLTSGYVAATAAADYALYTLRARVDWQRALI